MLSFSFLYSCLFFLVLVLDFYLRIRSKTPMLSIKEFSDKGIISLPLWLFLLIPYWVFCSNNLLSTCVLVCFFAVVCFLSCDFVSVDFSLGVGEEDTDSINLRSRVFNLLVLLVFLICELVLIGVSFFWILNKIRENGILT